MPPPFGASGEATRTQVLPGSTNTGDSFWGDVAVSGAAPFGAQGAAATVMPGPPLAAPQVAGTVFAPGSQPGPMAGATVFGSAIPQATNVFGATAAPPPGSAPMATGTVMGTNVASSMVPPPPGPVVSWGVDEVVQFIEGLGLGQKAAKFREDAVDGGMLASLSEDDLVSELGLSKLQARKVIQRLPQQ
eukprot:NODE_19137_length_858_cov_5.344733.p1 GENE.NODE_19137_length_858_cov_5.344733~~NODE_19137_length_858_cov_5.344733.p1  ORF type:complete len:204 (+),score=70.14 NODE_19137_length_858_cov_5.344733:48-614(+)